MFVLTRTGTETGRIESYREVQRDSHTHNTTMSDINTTTNRVDINIDNVDAKDNNTHTHAYRSATIICSLDIPIQVHLMM